MPFQNFQRRELFRKLFGAAVNALKSVKNLAAEVATYCWTFARRAKNLGPSLRS